MKQLSLLASATLMLAIVGAGGDASARYLQPEPMLHYPKFILSEATRGRSVSTYDYAHNNPTAFTDSTGLYSWRVACPDIPGFPNRGFVITKNNVWGDWKTWFLLHTGTVGLDSPGTTSCQDLELAKLAYSTKWPSPTLSNEFAVAKDCWDSLVSEMQDACNAEKKKCER